MLRNTAPFTTMLLAQTKVEFLRLVRIPSFAIATMAFPIMFYAFFGLANGHQAFMNTTIGLYLFASFSAYSVVSIALFSFGVSVAAERGGGAARLMRAAPMRPLAYFVAKFVAAMAFEAIAVTLLLLFAVIAGGTHISMSVYAILLVRLLLASAPFVTLGFAVGYMTSMSSAVAILNLISLPLSFASGLFVPLKELPTFVQAIAPYLPTYHIGQLAWGAVGATSESPQRAALWLVAYTAAFLLVALRAYYREERKEFA